MILKNYPVFGIETIEEIVEQNEAYWYLNGLTPEEGLELYLNQVVNTDKTWSKVLWLECYLITLNTFLGWSN